jgi:hypothetical protein
MEHEIYFILQVGRFVRVMHRRLEVPFHLFSFILAVIFPSSGSGMHQQD